MPRANSRTTGKLGEDLAVKYLLSKKYKILTRNYRTRIGEIDIVAVDSHGTLIFVEVKSLRTPIELSGSDDRAYPEEHMTPKKYKTISRVAELFCAEHSLTNLQEVRIDLIAIDLAPDGALLNIRHITNTLL